MEKIIVCHCVFLLLNGIFCSGYDTTKIFSFDVILLDTLSRLRDEFLENLYDTEKEIKSDLKRDLSQIVQTTLFDLHRSGQIDRISRNYEQSELDMLTRSVSQIKHRLHNLVRKQEWSEELAKQIVAEKKIGKKSESDRNLADKKCGCELKNQSDSADIIKSSTLTTKTPTLVDKAIYTHTTLLTPDRYEYFPLQDLAVKPSAGKTFFAFYVRAANDVHMALHRYAGDTDRDTYEIVIGGWSNTKSAIRSSTQGTDVAVFYHEPLNNQEFVPFWVSWSEGLVTVGSGKTVGVNQFMTWSDPNPHPVNYISVCTGWGATGTWWLDEKINVITPDLYEYTHGLTPQTDQVSFRFEVRAANDVHMALHRYAGDTDRDTYEIVIGGWSNTKSAIRSSTQGTDVAVFDHEPLNNQEFVPFWVSWIGGLVTVGSGKTVGVNQFMTWSDPNPHPVNYISVCTGWGATGTWWLETM